jgi:hypothetical protein
MELFISDTLWVITHSATAVQRVPYRVRRRRHWHGLWLSAWCPRRSAPVARPRLAAATAGARETLARAAGTQTGCWPTASRANQMFPPSWLHVHEQRVNENPSWFDLVSLENSRSKEVRLLRTYMHLAMSAFNLHSVSCIEPYIALLCGQTSPFLVLSSTILASRPCRVCLDEPPYCVGDAPHDACREAKREPERTPP